MSAQHTPGHKLAVNGPPGNLSGWTWSCECGQWRAQTPERGPYGRTTAKARIAQAHMAHGKHARAAIAKATTPTPGEAK